MTSRPAAGDTALNAWIRALDRTAQFGRGGGVSLPAMVADMAATCGTNVALLSDGDCLTYDDLAGQINRYARWVLQQQLEPGEVVCLLLPNSADYVAIWLGIISVRGVASLINSNLRGEALAWALSAVAPKHLIVGAELEGALVGLHGLPQDMRIWTHGAGGTGPRIDEHISGLGAEPLEAGAGRPSALSDLALLIHTSGTTGLPKAARVSHRRIAEWSCWFAGMIDTLPSDRMYNCLPLYHSVGGIVAIGAMLAGGGSVLIRPRFSASRFWEDVVTWDCTLFQYIGELCRYLVAIPPARHETAHRLRLCCGNGLRGDVWKPFQERFQIPRILEFYASTEGNVSLYNCPGKPGAVGHVPAFLAHRFPVALMRCELETGALLRGPDGLGVRCGAGEAGEALGRIGDTAAGAGRPFEGYSDDAASDAKIARDVLAVGDKWYRTGDLLRRDSAGFFYFVDRLGNNFRWKGENVAAEEVADLLRSIPGVADAVVYGVEVPGAEGRAGMAALAVGADFDLSAFRRDAEKLLPDYARPVFLRVGDSIAATGTFKPARALLVREAYDPSLVTDELYVDVRAQGVFVRLDAELHARLVGGLLRL